MTIEIPLSRGLVAKIDDSDYESISRHKWSVVDSGKGRFYATTSVQHNKVRKFLRMHRFVMAAKPWEVVDHINHDTLDNRKSNLRITDHAGNSANRKLKHLYCPLCNTPFVTSQVL
jgi:hypothetical protein